MKNIKYIPSWIFPQGHMSIGKYPATFQKRLPDPKSDLLIINGRLPKPSVKSTSGEPENKIWGINQLILQAFGFAVGFVGVSEALEEMTRWKKNTKDYDAMVSNKITTKAETETNRRALVGEKEAKRR